MNRCCAHEASEHQTLAACQEVIHYPSEDYPCLCTGFEGNGEKCSRCEHKAASHVVTRVCRPADGAFCDCRTPLV